MKKEFPLFLLVETISNIFTPKNCFASCTITQQEKYLNKSRSSHDSDQSQSIYRFHNQGAARKPIKRKKSHRNLRSRTTEEAEEQNLTIQFGDSLVFSNSETSSFGYGAGMWNAGNFCFAPRKQKLIAASSILRNTGQTRAVSDDFEEAINIERFIILERDISNIIEKISSKNTIFVWEQIPEEYFEKIKKKDFKFESVFSKEQLENFSRKLDMFTNQIQKALLWIPSVSINKFIETINDEMASFREFEDLIITCTKRETTITPSTEKETEIEDHMFVNRRNEEIGIALIRFKKTFDRYKRELVSKGDIFLGEYREYLKMVHTEGEIQRKCKQLSIQSKKRAHYRGMEAPLNSESVDNEAKRVISETSEGTLNKESSAIFDGQIQFSKSEIRSNTCDNVQQPNTEIEWSSRADIDVEPPSEFAAYEGEAEDWLKSSYKWPISDFEREVNPIVLSEMVLGDFEPEFSVKDFCEWIPDTLEAEYDVELLCKTAFDSSESENSVLNPGKETGYRTIREMAFEAQTKESVTNTWPKKEANADCDNQKDDHFNRLLLNRHGSDSILMQRPTLLNERQKESLPKNNTSNSQTGKLSCLGDVELQRMSQITGEIPHNWSLSSLRSSQSSQIGERTGSTELENHISTSDAPIPVSQETAPNSNYLFPSSSSNKNELVFQSSGEQEIKETNIITEHNSENPHDKSDDRNYIVTTVSDNEAEAICGSDGNCDDQVLK